MSTILVKGIIRNGRVEVAEPIDLPDGSEVIITANGRIPALTEDDRPMSPREIAETLAVMARVEPFEMTPEERADADAWEQRVSKSPDAETPALPAWCNFYAGMSDEEIAELERIILDRSNFMRPWHDEEE